MACKSLILGIIFSVGIFAVKSGVGLHYYLSKTETGKSKTATLTIYAASYLALFLVSGGILSRIDIIRHMEIVQAFIRSGMVVHLIIAGCLSLWGIRLLRQNRDADRASRGWLMLVVPCPVCAIVIFCSLGFLTACFPDSMLAATLLLFLVFLMINGFTVLVLTGGTRHHNRPPELVLGSAMLLIAVYFLLSVTVMPQFADADKIYRMALASAGDSSPRFQHMFLFAAGTAMIFVSGFAFKSIAIRRKS